MMATGAPETPPEVLTGRKNKLWKPDKTGRLLFRPRGLYGGAYVVETVEQRTQIEAFERTKMLLIVVLLGGMLGFVVPSMTGSRPSLAETIGELAFVLLIVIVIVVYSLVRGSQIAARTGLRRRP